MSETMTKTTEVHEENKMGTMPVNKLLLTMSFPMMVSMLVQALYNIVDSIFVAQIGENALTAVSLAFPIQTLMIAFGSGTGVGVNALLSRALGEKNAEKANKVAVHGLFLAVVTYILFLLIGLVAVKPFYLAQTTDAEIVTMGIDYLSIVCCYSFGLFVQFFFERLLQATGRTSYSMVTQLVGALINIALDPILIFGMFGLPAMGVKGAAIATVAGQIIAAVFGYFINLAKNKEIVLEIKGFRPEGNIIKQIYMIGVPSIIMQSIGSIMTFCMNKILIGFSSTATAVFGVYFKLQSFVFMPILGINNGLVPIVAYNFGARRKERMMQAYKLSILYAVIIMTAGLILFEAIPETLFTMFDASEHMLEMGVPALRIIAIHFPVAAYGIITGTMFQAIGKATYSMISSICRQLVVLLPAAWLLAQLGNVNYVWWAFPIAEIASALMTVYFYNRTYTKVIKKM